MDYDELMRDVKAAFADTPPPTDDNIICHDCEECRALYDDVRGHTPDELSDSWVEKSFDQLPFFSDDAKRYYLPAFLRVAALKPDSTVTQFVLYSLSDGFRIQPSGGYSAQQQQAIRDFLGYIELRVGEHEQDYFCKGEGVVACGHLTNRSSQPLAAVMSTLNFMKQFSMFAGLAAASGGSAPSR